MCSPRRSFFPSGTLTKNDILSNLGADVAHDPLVAFAGGAMAAHLVLAFLPVDTSLGCMQVLTAAPFPHRCSLTRSCSTP